MSIMVCVTGQKSCERLIVAGAKIAKEDDQPLAVMHVARKGNHVLGNTNEAEALEYLLEISMRYGADMFVKKNDNVLDVIENEARELDVRTIVAGRSAHYNGWDMLDELKMRLTDVRFEILGA